MPENKSLGKIIFNGLITENPTFRLVLGMCPTLAVTTMAINGIGMGLATALVLVMSNFFISLLRNFIPEDVRIPAFVVIIATATTIVEMLMRAFVPFLADTLGLYIRLIVVNCIIFARAESFAYYNPPLPSLVDGLGMGLGFAGALTILAIIREIIGMGSLFGVQILPNAPIGIVSMPAGGFFTLGFILAAVNGVIKIVEKRKQSANESEVAA